VAVIAPLSHGWLGLLSFLSLPVGQVRFLRSTHAYYFCRHCDCQQLDYRYAHLAHVLASCCLHGVLYCAVLYFAYLGS